MKKPVYNGAIIGCGIISNVHARAYTKVDRAKLFAVCDKDRVRARRLAKKYNISKVFTDYKTLLLDDTIDFVEILTPHSTHVTIAEAAAKKGKHINLQKVQAPTLKGHEQIKSVIKKYKIKLRVLENFRYYEPYIFAKKLITDGVVGDVRVVNIKKWGGLKNKLQGGVKRVKAYAWRARTRENHNHPTIFDDGYHKHSLIEYFLGKKVIKVRAWCGYRNYLGKKLDSPVQVEYLTKDNSLGTFQSINIKTKIYNHFYPCDEVIEIIGTKGVIHIYGGHGLLFTSKHFSIIKQGVYWMSKRTKHQWKYNGDMNIDIRDSFVRGLEEFIQYLDGSSTLLFDLQDAEQSLRMGLGIIKSLKEYNRYVELEEL